MRTNIDLPCPCVCVCVCVCVWACSSGSVICKSYLILKQKWWSKSLYKIWNTIVRVSNTTFWLKFVLHFKLSVEVVSVTTLVRRFAQMTCLLNPTPTVDILGVTVTKPSSFLTSSKLWHTQAPENVTWQNVSSWILRSLQLHRVVCAICLKIAWNNWPKWTEDSTT